jgi:catechol 2,3-dioxygenase-like lactoylglutathione lyase family enzyme
MAVAHPEQPISVAFAVDGQEYRADLRRGQIVHEAFHAALPKELTVGHRLQFRTPAGAEVFADNFLGDLADAFEMAAEVRLVARATPLTGRTGRWRNHGFDHHAITVGDRSDARDFFRDIVGMRVMRDDPHLTVLAAPSGQTALFLFDAGQEAPLSDGRPSTWHHLGFVVDDLEACYADLQAHRDRLLSDFTLLERDERWSLYCFYRNGDVTFMLQFSEVKPADRGFHDPERSGFAGFLYDYASRPYGHQFGSNPSPGDPPVG